MPDRTMSRGDTFVLDIQVFQAPQFGSPPGAPTPPQDVTGWFFWFTAKYQVNDADSMAVSQLTNASPSTGITFIQPTIGRVRCIMPAVATRSFPDGPVQLVYDVQAQDLLGNISTVESGTLTVNPDTTRTITPPLPPPPPAAGPIWTQVNHAQSPFAPTPTQAQLLVDSTAGVVVINARVLPDSTVFIVRDDKGTSTLNDILVNAPTGWTIDDPSNPGHTGAQAKISSQGATVWWQYDVGIQRIIWIAGG
jgi:hypothetical protein